jgi:hypothetical protein
MYLFILSADNTTERGCKGRVQFVGRSIAFHTSSSEASAIEIAYSCLGQRNINNDPVLVSILVADVLSAKPLATLPLLLLE